jgi:hypothetical protein
VEHSLRMLGSSNLGLPHRESGILSDVGLARGLNCAQNKISSVAPLRVTSMDYVVNS